MAKNEQNEDEQVTESEDAEVRETTEVSDEPDTDRPVPHRTSEPVAASPKQNIFKRLWHWKVTHKKIAVPLDIVLALAVLAAIPFTRYAIAGTFWKQDIRVAVLDAQTKKPISSATVSVTSKTATTDNRGRASLHANTGYADMTVSKKYYKTVVTKHVLVPIAKPKADVVVKLEATGRQVPVTVVNKLTNKAVSNAVIKAADTEAKTDKDGKAIMVLPADKTTIAATISANGHNSATATIAVTTETVKANTFQLTPSGKLYFLSNLSGKIDVVKTNLDGSERQTVLAGTGNENAANTVLLASRDWKYLALLSRRDTSGYDKIYLIETATDKLTTMDEGQASFNLVGWADHRFVYHVVRDKVQSWENNKEALKSYDAEAGKIVTLDQTQGAGNSTNYQYQRFTNIYPLNNLVLYTVQWDTYNASQKVPIVRGIQPNGQGKKDYKSFDEAGGSAYVQALPYGPEEVYFSVYYGGTAHYYEFEDGAVKNLATGTGDTAFARSYPTYLLSPSAKQTFWADQRDGRNALFIGDDEGKDEKQITSLSDYNTYGWYTDNYLLVTKKGSELYILPTSGDPLLKVSDYYKPQQNFRGYGGGYGGL